MVFVSEQDLDFELISDLDEGFFIFIFVENVKVESVFSDEEVYGFVDFDNQ